LNCKISILYFSTHMNSRSYKNIIFHIPSSDHMILWTKTWHRFRKLTLTNVIEVDHNNSMKRCTIDNMWVRGVLNCNVFVALVTRFIPQNLAYLISTSPCTCELNYTSLKRGKVLDGDLALMCVCARTHTHTWLSFGKARDLYCIICKWHILTDTLSICQIGTLSLTRDV